MDRALYIAMTGAKQTMLAQTTHANNLANANTNAFRADFEQMRSQPVVGGDGHPTRVYVQTERPATDFSSGIVNETGRNLDIAIEGGGFLVVELPDGSEALTRNGHLQVDDAGRLLSGEGLQVMGEEGPVILPPFESITLGAEGSISVQPLGSQAQEVLQLPALRLVNPEIAGLIKGEDGMIRSDQALESAPEVRIASGFLEGSNVDVVSEFTDILALSRQYEMQVKMMQTVEEAAESSGQLLRLG